MSITFPGTLTGAEQTGFTSPTYTTAADNAPDFNAKQVAVTAVGGTQAGVTAHSVSSPFFDVGMEAEGHAVARETESDYGPYR